MRINQDNKAQPAPPRQGRPDRAVQSTPTRSDQREEKTMCQIFAGQDPANYECITRSVRLDGHATSIRLESAFWDILEELAASQEKSLPRFISTLYDEVLELHGKVSNFASLLRICCVLYLRNAAGGQAVTEPAVAQAVA